MLLTNYSLKHCICNVHTHTHTYIYIYIYVMYTHTHIYIYIYIYIYVCVCARARICVCVALNNFPGLICHKIQPSQTKPINLFFASSWFFLLPFPSNLLLVHNFLKFSSLLECSLSLHAKYFFSKTSHTIFDLFLHQLDIFIMNVIDSLPTFLGTFSR